MSFSISVSGHVKGATAHQRAVEEKIHAALDTFVRDIHALGADVASASFSGQHTAHSVTPPPDHPEPAAR